MSGAMNRHCIPGLTMSTALTGTAAGVSGIIKTVTQGLARTYCICPTPGADTENRTFCLTWERFV